MFYLEDPAIFTTRRFSLRAISFDSTIVERKRHAEAEEEILKIMKRSKWLTAYFVPHETGHNLLNLHKRNMNNPETCALIMQGSTRKEDKPVMKILERRKRGYKYE